MIRVVNIGLEMTNRSYVSVGYCGLKPSWFALAVGGPNYRSMSGSMCMDSFILTCLVRHRFIKEHFADAFRLLPESPPRMGTREETWISSATLQQSSIQEVLSPPLHPSTPEPHGSYIPPFALSTPSGTSPKSIKSSSPGSPLQPIQFIRRADRESPMLRADTPTKMRPSSVAHTPKHPHPAWRP